MKKLAFVIHDLNKNGGQERSTWEIINQIKDKFEIHIYANTYDKQIEGTYYHHVPVILRRPLFIKDFFFRIFSSLMLSFKKYDVVHCTGTCVFKADIFTIQFIQKRWCLTPKKISIKDWIQLQIDLFWEAIIFKINRKSRFIAISKSTQNDLKQLFDLEQVDCISHGVNLEEFRPDSSTRQSLGLDDNKKYLLFVGAFERKGLFYLLEALANVFPQFKDWELLVVGSGPFQKVKDFCIKKDIMNRVHLLGHQTQVHKYYQNADLFILPSLYDPFGLVGIEALACGCPSILSQASGCSDLIENDRNGWIIKNPTDIQELILILNKAFDSKNLKDMKSLSIKSVANQGWNSKVSRYLEIFNQEV